MFVVYRVSMTAATPLTRIGRAEIRPSARVYVERNLGRRVEPEPALPTVRAPATYVMIRRCLDEQPGDGVREAHHAGICADSSMMASSASASATRAEAANVVERTSRRTKRRWYIGTMRARLALSVAPRSAVGVAAAVANQGRSAVLVAATR